MSDQLEHERNGYRRVALFVALVGIVVAYPLSLGPIYAAVRMEWISDDTFFWLVEGPYGPLHTLFMDGMAKDGPGTTYSKYIFWWCELTNP